MPSTSAMICAHSAEREPPPTRSTSQSPHWVAQGREIVARGKGNTFEHA
jgi:hypothetical protein